MHLVQLALVAAVLAASSTNVFVTGDTPKPSDTNNLPATPPPANNNNNNNNNNTPPPGQTPAPKATPPTSNTPPPGQQTPKPSAAAATQTPAPSPSTPTPTTAAPPPAAAVTPQPSATASVSNSSSSSTGSTTTAPSTPSPTPLLETSNTSSDDSGGMSAGGVIGIILAVLAFVGIAGFFLYRHLRARSDRDDDNGGKHFDYPVGNSPQEVTIMGSQQTDYAMSKMERASSQDMPIMAAGAGSVLSSLNNSSYASGSAMQNTYNSNNNAAAATTSSSSNATTTSYGQYGQYGNGAAAGGASAAVSSSKYNNGNGNGNVTLYSESASVSASPPAFTKSTSRYLSGPDQESPPFKKTDVQLSRPSSVMLDEPMEFNHSFAESYAESYSESYSDRGYMSSFVQGMPGAEGLSVGAESAMGDALDRDTATQHENAHWLDAMRDTGDSYAMLEADAYGSERGSAISRFSTDSEYNESRQL